MRVVAHLSPLDYAGLCRDLLDRQCDVTLRAKGNSMAPTIHNGDFVTLRPARKCRIRPQQIVLTERDGTVLIHRLVAKNGRYWTTRGDNCQSTDPPVTDQHILAQVIEIRPRPGVRRLLKSYRNSAKLAARHSLATIQASRTYRRAARRVAACIPIRFQWADSLLAQRARERWPDLAETGPNTWERRLAIATAGGRPLACLLLQPYLPEPERAERWIFGMRVSLPARGAGIGEALLRWSARQALLAGAETLMLWVERQNHTAIALYAKMGFREITAPELAPTAEHVVMRKRLCR